MTILESRPGRCIRVPEGSLSLRLRLSAGLLISVLHGATATPRIYAQGPVCDPLDFGAAGDGVNDDTQAVQTALDSCVGGGTVHVSPGTYAIKPLVFNGNGVTLQLDAGATLAGSPDPGDYSMTDALISADTKTDLAIMGPGTIDGSGSAFWGVVDPRPRLIRFRRCRRVLVQDVTLQNSPSFHLVPQDTSDITIDNVTILAPPASPNTDGIDIGGSNINVSRCYIDTGDDNVAIKAGSGVHVNGVTVRDCTFLRGHGLSMGSELDGGVENFTAQNITFNGTDNGMRIKTDRSKGGIVTNVSYDSITMTNVGRIIDIAGYYPESTIPPPFSDPPQPITATSPMFSNISVSNLTSTGGGNRSPNGAFFVGVPEAPITGVIMQNVSIVGAARSFELRNVAVQTCNVAVNRDFVLDENATLADDGCTTAGYTLSVSPDSQTVAQGESTTYTVTVTPSGDFTGPVDLRVSGLPGTTSTFDPPTVIGSGGRTLTVATSNLTPTGSFPLTITGVSGTTGLLNRIVVATLVVR
jgi:polygalacturonase